MDSSIVTRPEVIGVMLGCLLGLLGGITGTYFSYRKAKSHAERVWILFYATAILAFCIVLAAVMLINSRLGWIIFQIGYPLALVASIIAITRHLKQIREDRHQ